MKSLASFFIDTARGDDTFSFDDTRFVILLLSPVFISISTFSFALFPSVLLTRNLYILVLLEFVLLLSGEGSGGLRLDGYSLNKSIDIKGVAPSEATLS